MNSKVQRECGKQLPGVATCVLQVNHDGACLLRAEVEVEKLRGERDTARAKVEELCEEVCGWKRRAAFLRCCALCGEIPTEDEELQAMSLTDEVV